MGLDMWAVKIKKIPDEERFVTRRYANTLPWTFPDHFYWSESDFLEDSEMLKKQKH